MKVHIAATLFAIGVALPGLAYAAEGANTGSATSTPAGPAGDNQGPSKSTNPSTGGAGMKSESGAMSGTGENKQTSTGGQPGGGAGRN